MQTITSRDNAAVKNACRLRDDERARAAAGLFFAEGPKLCLELARGCRLHTLFATEAALARTPALAAFADVTALVAPHVAEKLAGTASTQQVFALFAAPAPAPGLLQTAGRILALDAVQDPGNVGTLLRSAAAFGFELALLGPGCAAPFAPKTLRAGMGAAGQLPVLCVEDLPAALAGLRGRGVACLAAALYGAKPLGGVPRHFPGGVCVAIGSEGRGLSRAVADACTAAVRIPMTDRVESLNAGAAGSVLLWHFRAPELRLQGEESDG